MLDEKVKEMMNDMKSREGAEGDSHPKAVGECLKTIDFRLIDGLKPKSLTPTAEMLIPGYIHIQEPTRRPTSLGGATLFSPPTAILRTTGSDQKPNTTTDFGSGLLTLC